MPVVLVGRWGPLHFFLLQVKEVGEVPYVFILYPLRLIVIPLVHQQPDHGDPVS